MTDLIVAAPPAAEGSAIETEHRALMTARNFELRAQESLQKEAATLLKAIIKNFPESSIPALQKVEALGWTRDRLPRSDMPLSKQKTAIAARDRRLKDAKAQGMEQVAKLLNADPADIIPPKRRKVGDFTLYELEHHCCKAIERNTWSISNLKAMYIKMGKRKDYPLSNKGVLLAMIEGSTGIPETFELSGELRQWSALGKFLFGLNVERGRMLADVCMPPEFDGGDKAYDKEYLPDGSTLTLFMPKLGECSKVSIPASMLPAGYDEKVCTIAYNWSFERACFQFQGMDDYNRKSALQCRRVYQYMSDAKKLCAELLKNSQVAAITNTPEPDCSAASAADTPRFRAARKRSWETVTPKTKGPIEKSPEFRGPPEVPASWKVACGASDSGVASGSVGSEQAHGVDEEKADEQAEPTAKAPKVNHDDNSVPPPPGEQTIPD